MLKNRDTPSNPYRVPPQPTPIGVKLAITFLFICVVALMGAILFLVVSPRCAQVCTGVETTKKTTNLRSPMIEMADQGVVESGIDQESSQYLSRRVEKLDRAVAGLQSRISDLEYQMTINSGTGGAPTPSTGSLSRTQLALISKVPRLDAMTRDLQNKLTQHLKSAKKICKEGHYRYGVHCFVIGEGALAQSDAKRWCRLDYGDQANLAIIKDKLTQEFLAGKLPNRDHSYWIGIERQSPALSSLTELITTAAIQDEPAPLGSGQQFEFSDGTRVQRNGWHLWSSRTPSGGGAAGRERNCASMSFEQTTQQWKWDEKSCTDRNGYICQYYIMTR